MAEQTMIRVDKDTRKKLKSLAGEQPVAAYLRELSEKGQTVAGSIGELQASMQEVINKLDWLVSRVNDISTLTEAMDCTLTTVLKGYDVAMRDNHRWIQAKNDRAEKEARAASKMPGGIRAYLKLDEPGVVKRLPQFVWNEKLNDFEYNEDGTPKIADD